MRIEEQRRGYFRGTHKGYEIEIERDAEHREKAFYIRVQHIESGIYAYDGWAPTNITTLKAAKLEAFYGAGLKARP